MIGPMGRMSFLVSALLAFALAASVLAAALLVGLFPSGGGVAVATTRPTSTPGGSVLVTPSPVPTVAPTPTPEPTIDLGQGGTYTVKPGDSLSLIGQKLGIAWQAIAEANGIAGPDYVITPGQVLIIPAVTVPTAGADTYFVQSGDTITAIAELFGVTPTDLADFNYIADWNSIQVGDLLYIPGPGWTPRPTPTF
jgi:LysM repeat protein